MDKTVKVGILTKNFSNLNNIIGKLKHTEFNLTHLKEIPNILHEIDILVTDESTKNCQIPYVTPKDLDILELKIRCEYYQKKSLTIGIDPGGICGLVVLSNNYLLYQREFNSIELMASIINSINNEIGIKNIKIGLGSPPIRNLIVESLEYYQEKILFIDENQSGSGSHIHAAMRIAKRLPETKKPDSYSPKEGEIAWIQKQSRRISKGLITINKETANRILLGELSMDNAIEYYTNKLIKKPSTK